MKHRCLGTLAPISDPTPVFAHRASFASLLKAGFRTTEFGIKENQWVCQASSTSRSSRHREGLQRQDSNFDHPEGKNLERNYSNNVVQSAKRKNYSNGIHSQSKRIKVAVDVDEVLGRFLHSLNKYCEEEFHTQYDISDYKQYDFASVWGCSLDEANTRVHKFFESHHFAIGIEAMPGATESLQELQKLYDLVVVTSRQFVIQDQTLEWLDKEFPSIFKEVHFGNHWALSGKSKKKSEICQDIGASILIDDNPKYALDCANNGIDVLLYDWHLAYPWAKTVDGPNHPRIRRVQDWREVEKQLRTLAAQHNSN